MKKCIILIALLSFSYSYAIDLQEYDKDHVIYTLNYIREENKQAAEKLETLYIESVDAVEKSRISNLIDILLQACIYLTERIKYFEENFHNKPELLAQLEEEFQLLKEL